MGNAACFQDFTHALLHAGAVVGDGLQCITFIKNFQRFRCGGQCDGMTGLEQFQFLVAKRENNLEDLFD